LPIDTMENLVNLGISGYGAAKGVLGFPGSSLPDPISNTPLGSQWIKEKMRGGGALVDPPRPDDVYSRMLGTAGQIGGASMFPGATIKNTIAPMIATPAVEEVFGKEYAPIGVVAPAFLGKGISSARQGIAKKATPLYQTFKRAGAEPSVGMVTNNAFFHGIENLLSKFPGGAGVMKRYSERLQSQIGSDSRTGVSAEAAGRVIERGITGKGGFIERTSNTWNKLDNATAAKIPKTAKFKPTNTIQALDDLTTPVVGAERTTEALVNPKISSISTNLKADVAADRWNLNIGGQQFSVPRGNMHYEALRALRTKVGSMIDDAIVSGTSGGELKKIYGALSEDMRMAAHKAGAGREFDRQNIYYRARMDRINSVLDRVIGKGKQSEDIYKAFEPRDPEAAGKVRAVMRSLKPDERKVVTEAVVNRLGRAKSSKQDEFGEVFSSETFLTNWNNLSKGAKAQLFPDVRMRGDLDAIAKSSEILRTGSKVFSNASGTAGSFAAYSVYLSPIVSIGTGTVAPVASAAGMAGTAYLGSKLLTSQSFVRWLSTSPARNTNDIATSLARLSVIFNNSDDEGFKNELTKYIQSLQTDIPSVPIQE